MGLLADRLAQVTESHAREIAKQWARAVRRNPKTPSFHKIPKNQCILFATDFYRKFVKVFFEKKPYLDLEELFTRYAEACFKEEIPLPETIHALLMLRRHMWLYTDSQATFNSVADQHQAVETINKTIRIFDQGIYLIIRRYGELSSEKA